jgi:predicted enzyme related to lactoylglutathione lyase
MFKNLRRIAYQVSDVEKAKAWYSEFLRQEPDYDSPFVVIYKIGEGSLSLVKGPERLPEDAGRASTYWEVEDVDAALKRMIDLGATVKTEAKNVLTIRTAQVVDPFGNVIGLSGKIPHAENRTIENRPSETAHSVALCRALASYDERAEIRRPDAYSELFLGDEIKLSIKEASKRKGFWKG